MDKYKVGDRILNISPNCSGKNYGKKGTVQRIDYYCHIRYDDGKEGCSCTPEEDYKLLNKKTFMSTVKEFVKALTLSAEEKLMRKHGLKTECGDYTQDAKDAIINKLCAADEAYLVTIAQGLEDEAKKE